jgi:hypothetical protein
LPPRIGGGSFDPDDGLGPQGFADRLTGRRVAAFAVHHPVHSVFQGELHFFYPAARGGPGPGLCRARVYFAKGGTGAGPGNWQGEVFAVAGSVAPLPRPWPAGYRERLGSACRARRDMGLWYSAPEGKAHEAARLADAVVASARTSGALPFELACRPFPPGLPEAPRCSADVRKVVAAADPRAIVWVGECDGETGRQCLAVGLAQRPERGSAAAEDQWRLNVQYRGEGDPRIVRVDVDDAVIIFE